MYDFVRKNVLKNKSMYNRRYAEIFQTGFRLTTSYCSSLYIRLIKRQTTTW